MTGALVGLIMALGLYMAAKPVMLAVLARFILRNETYDDFLRQVLNFVYACSFVVAGTWLVLGDASTYLIMYSTFCLLILLRFDYDEAEEDYHETRQQMIRIRSDL